MGAFLLDSLILWGKVKLDYPNLWKDWQNNTETFSITRIDWGTSIRII